LEELLQNRKGVDALRLKVDSYKQIVDNLFEIKRDRNGKCEKKDLYLWGEIELHPTAYLLRSGWIKKQ
jgi:hypothetical protein